MTDFRNYPMIGRLKEQLQGDFIASGLIEQIDLLAKRYGEEYLNLAEKVLAKLKEIGDDGEYDPLFICQQYIYDYLQQMNLFLKSGNYGHGDYEEIKRTIYHNADVMLKTYMPGLFLAYANTTILYTKYNLFKNAFLPRLNSQNKGIEVGFGEGFYLWELSNHIPGIDFVGYDISSHAITFASKLFDQTDMSSALLLGDITKGISDEDSSYDFGILAEVIEHVESPEKCIAEMSRLIKAKGFLYLTTVIDSNHMDHITNFESPEVVESMICDAGFSLHDKSIYHIQDDFPKSKDISIGLAYVCEKK